VNVFLSAWPDARAAICTYMCRDAKCHLHKCAHMSSLLCTVHVLHKSVIEKPTWIRVLD